MKTTLSLAALLALATAAPLDTPNQNAAVVRRAPSPSSATPPYLYSAPYGYSSGYPIPSGSGTAGAPYPTATGLAPASPTSTGALCSPNGVLVCNGLYEFGLCNWGRVSFQPVANGTACVDGAITWAPWYPHAK